MVAMRNEEAGGADGILDERRLRLGQAGGEMMSWVEARLEQVSRSDGMSERARRMTREVGADAV